MAESQQDYSTSSDEAKRPRNEEPQQDYSTSSDEANSPSKRCRNGESQENHSASSDEANSTYKRPGNGDVLPHGNSCTDFKLSLSDTINLLGYISSHLENAWKDRPSHAIRRRLKALHMSSVHRQMMDFTYPRWKNENVFHIAEITDIETQEVIMFRIHYGFWVNCGCIIEYNLQGRNLYVPFMMCGPGELQRVHEDLGLCVKRLAQMNLLSEGFVTVDMEHLNMSYHVSYSEYGKNTFHNTLVEISIGSALE